MMESKDMIEACLKHSLYSWSANGKVNPLPVARAEGMYLYTPEGKRILEPIKGPLANTLIEMEQDVQSSISYSGGKKLMDIRKVNYVILGGDNAGEHLLM